MLQDSCAHALRLPSSALSQAHPPCTPLTRRCCPSGAAAWLPGSVAPPQLSALLGSSLPIDSHGVHP